MHGSCSSVLIGLRYRALLCLHLRVRTICNIFSMEFVIAGSASRHWTFCMKYETWLLLGVLYCLNFTDNESLLNVFIKWHLGCILLSHIELWAYSEYSNHIFRGLVFLVVSFTDLGECRWWRGLTRLSWLKWPPGCHLPWLYHQQRSLIHSRSSGCRDGWRLVGWHCVQPEPSGFGSSGKGHGKNYWFLWQRHPCTHLAHVSLVSFGLFSLCRWHLITKPEVAVYFNTFAHFFL